MTVKQISAFLENRPGALAEFTKILQNSEIDLAPCLSQRRRTSALSV